MVVNSRMSNMTLTSIAEDSTHPTTNGQLRPSPSKVEPTFTAPYGPNVHISKHPVLAHKLSILRSSSTSPSSFRAVLREITFHLGYEATSTLTTREIPITVPATNHIDHIDAVGQKVKEKVAIIPILRSGLGMVDPMLELLSNAQVHHIGMYRSKSLMPVQYYNRLPKKCTVDVAYVLDPLIATSATIISVCGILKKVSFSIERSIKMSVHESILFSRWDCFARYSFSQMRRVVACLILELESLAHFLV